MHVTHLYKVGQNTSRLLLAAGDLIIGWLLVRQAEVARAALVRHRVGQGPAVLRGQARGHALLRPQVLPELAAERQIAEATDNALMDVSEDAF